MSTERAAEVMAEHIQDNQGRCDVCYRTSWPCLPYRLAEALLAALKQSEARAQHMYEIGLRAGAVGGEWPNGADAECASVEFGPGVWIDKVTAHEELVYEYCRKYEGTVTCLTLSDPEPCPPCLARRMLGKR